MKSLSTLAKPTTFPKSQLLVAWGAFLPGFPQAFPFTFFTFSSFFFFFFKT